MRRLLLLIAGLVILGGAFGFARRSILSWLGKSLVSSESPRAADLILVLGGDFWGARVVKAAELGKAGYAPIVLISSPPYAGRPEGDLAINFLARQGYSKDLFAVFAHDARSTIAEANVLRGELSRRGAKRVLLVTSSYHSRRAKLVFRLFCPAVEFISVPAADPVYDPETWWRGKGSRGIFFNEWTKIFGTLLIAYPTYVLRRI